MADNRELFRNSYICVTRHNIKESSEFIFWAVEQNHEKADIRIILHALHSVEILQAERVAVYPNGTDIIVLCIIIVPNILY